MSYVAQSGSEAPASLKANITTSFSTEGERTITARYSGDAYYAAAESAATTINVVGSTAVDFSLPATAPSIAIASAGQSGTTSIPVTSVNGFAGEVSLTCTVNSTVAKAPGCSISPGTVTTSAYGSATATLTVTTTAPTQTTAQSNWHAGWMGGGLFACVLLCVPGLRRRSRLSLVMLILALLMINGTVACGGDSHTQPPPDHTTIPGTPAGTYSITITGVAQVNGVTTTHTSAVSVTVQ